MKIKYWGHSCFECTDKNGVVLITDPYTGVGYELPHGLRADIVTVSHGHYDHNYISAIQAEKVVSAPSGGAYKGIEVRGVECYHDPEFGALRGKNTVFKFVMDGLTVCHMGDIGEEVSQELVARIGKVDVLLVPVGGTYTVDALGAKAYIDAISPNVVIPMHYKPTDGTINITGIQPFLDVCGVDRVFVKGEAQITADSRGVIYMERAEV